MQDWLAWCDDRPAVQNALQAVHRRASPSNPCSVGGVSLRSPLILAAGLVKGKGFATEEEALAAVERGENIISGWRTMPHLSDAVELGSFTRYPRLGNTGQVIWRDAPSRSTQNRIGLKNPGAQAAACFLGGHRPAAPFGINLAVSPGVSELDQEESELAESLAFFLQADLRPDWVTLNLSCPNTEDDPSGHQTDHKTRVLCRRLISQLGEIPLWVKISPKLATEQYHQLMRVFAEEGVKAVIATNTLAQPSPDDPNVMAGVGGGRLHDYALQAVEALNDAKQQHGYPVDIVGCGGAVDAASYRAFRARGVAAVQYWSALVYQGPLAHAILQQS